MTWGNRGGGNPYHNRGRPNMPTHLRKILMSVTIAPAQREWLLTFGRGNVSQGVRKAVAIAMQVQATAIADRDPKADIEAARMNVLMDGLRTDADRAAARSCEPIAEDTDPPTPATFVSTEDFD
jgi:hypothetical protein